MTTAHEQSHPEAPWTQPDYQARLAELTGSYLQSSLQTAKDIRHKLTRPREGWSTDLPPSVWPSVGKRIAGKGLEKMNPILWDNEDSWGNGGKPDRQDPFDQTIKKVAADWYGTLEPGRVMRGVDSVYADFGGELADLAITLNDDPAQINKAEQTIALLVAFGSYKLGQWSTGKQLGTAAMLMERFTERTPGFDPWKAGLAPLVSNIALAMGGGGPHMADALKNASRAEAHLAIRREQTVARITETEAPTPLKTTATLGQSAVSESVAQPARRRPVKHIARRIGQHGSK